MEDGSSTARSVVIAVAFLSLCHSRQATLPGAVPCTPLPEYSMFPRFLARSLPDPGAASPKRYCRGRYSLVRRFLAFYTIRDENFAQKHTSKALNLQKVHNSSLASTHAISLPFSDILFLNTDYVAVATIRNKMLRKIALYAIIFL